MSSKSYQSNHELNSGRKLGLSHDARQGLGYGLTRSNFHNQRQKDQLFPYVTDSVDLDNLQDLDLDINVLQQIQNKIDTPYKSGDSLIGRSADHSAFVSANHPLSAVSEITAKGMVPFPGMYKNRMQVGGGVNSPKLIAPGGYNRTGTYFGWSHAPVDDNIDNDYNEYDEETISLEKARKIVKKVLKNNLKSI
jgi:hypothetical protein|tara:strand:+ start:348 stop:926 length:579 start_codon:yes stop_codon:yes gene_type:complete